MLNHRRLLLSRILALAVGVAAALTTSTWAQSQWTQVGPASGLSSLGDSLVVECGRPPAPGVVWLTGNDRFATSTDRGSSWRFAAPAASLGAVQALAADRSTPRLLWAATVDGFFRTDDGGAHWQTLSDDSYRLALDGEPPSEIITDPQNRWLFVTSLQRLLASSDGGTSWRLSYVTPDYTTLRSFVAQPRNTSPPVLYLSTFGSDSEFLRSTDGGTSWASIQSLPIPLAGVDPLVASAAAVFAALDGENAGIYRSTDRGESWQPVLGGQPSRRFQTSALALDLRTPGFVYAYGRLGSDNHRLWLSRDGGVFWKRLGSVGASALAIEPATATLYGRGGKVLSRSLDRGEHWSTVFVAPDTESSWAQLTIRRGDSAQRLLTVGFSVFRTDDAGASWRWISGSNPGSPPYPSSFTAVDVDPQDPQRLIGVGGPSGNSFAKLSTDGGATWKDLATRLSYAESLLRLGGKKLLVGGCGVARTTDNGLTWRETLPCSPFHSDLGRWTQKIEADPTHPGVVYALGFVAEIEEFPHGLLTDFPSFLWRSDDNGATWTKVARNLRALAVDSRDGRLLGARGRTLLASDDLGASWHQVATTPWPFDDLAIDPLRSDRVFALRGSGDFLCSANGGGRWDPLPRGGPPGEEGRLFIHPAEPSALYAASRWGVSRLPLPAGVCE